MRNWTILPLSAARACLSEQCRGVLEGSAGDSQALPAWCRMHTKPEPGGARWRREGGRLWKKGVGACGWAEEPVVGGVDARCFAGERFHTLPPLRKTLSMGSQEAMSHAC